MGFLRCRKIIVGQKCLYIIDIYVICSTHVCLKLLFTFLGGFKFNDSTLLFSLSRKQAL